MRNLHIIMPMAGEGSRFRNAGWTTPKPLIELNGKPLFVRAIESVRVEGAPMKYQGNPPRSKYLFCRKDNTWCRRDVSHRRKRYRR